MATKIELKNLKGVYYIAPDGSIISDSTATIQPGSIGITVTPSDTNLDAVDIVFPEGVKVEAYSSKKNTGAMSGTVQALLKTLWVDEISQMRYDDDEDKLYIDCTLADDEGDVDDDEVEKVIDKFKESRKEHNALCKPATKNSDDDSNPPADPPADSDDNSDGDDGNPPTKDKPKKQPQKRAPRKDNESASGQTLEFVDRDQADRDTHATLVAIGGEEFAKRYNGLIWDETSQTYKDET